MLETDRLIIRRFTFDDLDALARLRADPEVMRYITTPEPQTFDVVERRIERLLREYDERGFAMWAVTSKETGELMGWCGFGYLDNMPPTVEIGYGFGKPHWGKGFASEAARACLRYGFEELNFERVAAVALPENYASRHVMEKLGFDYLRDAFHWNSIVVYYELARENFKHGDYTYILHGATL